VVESVRCYMRSPSLTQAYQSLQAGFPTRVADCDASTNTLSSRAQLSTVSDLTTRQHQKYMPLPSS